MFNIIPTFGFGDVPASSVVIGATQIVFGDGISSESFSVELLNTGIPSLQQTFSLTLTTPNRTDVLASENTTCVITVAEHDYPYGVFIINNDSRVFILSQNHSDQFVTVHITRTNGLYFDQTIQFSVNDTSHAVIFTNTVTFLAGQSDAYITVSIPSNNSPELQTTVAFALVSVSSGKAIIGSQSTALITIQQHDDPNGIIFIASSPSVVNIDVGSIFLQVVRSAGLYGTISADYSFFYLDTQSVVTSGTITFSVCLSINCFIIL